MSRVMPRQTSGDLHEGMSRVCALDGIRWPSQRSWPLHGRSPRLAAILAGLMLSDVIAFLLPSAAWAEMSAPHEAISVSTTPGLTSKVPQDPKVAADNGPTGPSAG